MDSLMHGRRPLTNDSQIWADDSTVMHGRRPLTSDSQTWADDSVIDGESGHKINTNT